MNFLTNINLNGNELQNVVIQNVATDPSNPKKGQLWFNTTDGVFKYLKDANDIKVIGNGNGTLTEADITELREAVNNLDSVVNSEENGLSAVASKADNAETIAESASEVAGQAKASADSAVAEAQTATSTANSATTAANEAKGTASEAATTANEAKEIANRAESTVNDAATAASTAQETADNAAVAAAAAQTTADSKVEKVVGEVDNIVLFAADGALKDSGIKIADIEAGGSGEADTSGLISKVSGAVEGNLPSLAADGSLVDSGYSVKGTLSSEGSTEIPTSNAVALYVGEQLSGITQGIVFRGTLNSSNSITVPYNVGDMYYVGEAGNYYGYDCEAGDVFIAKTEKTSIETFDINDWSVLESNKDVFKGNAAGLVPPAPVNNNLSYLDSTGAWTAPVATRWAQPNPILNYYSGDSVTWEIEHNLGRMDVQVTVYEVISAFEYIQVMCDVTLTGKNKCEITFNTSSGIDEGKYFAVVM